MRNKTLLALAAVIALGTAWAYLYWMPHRAAPTATESHPAAETPTAPPAATVAAADYVLQSADAAVSIKDYRGKVVLLYFGYTSCRKECPAALATLAQALSALDESELRQVQALFVSLDPERDTQEKLRDYTGYYNPRLLGLTGSPEQLVAATAAYGASFKKQDAKEDGSYDIEHPTAIYVVDPNGLLQASLPQGTPATDVLAEIRKLVRERLTTPPSPPTPSQ